MLFTSIFLVIDWIVLYINQQKWLTYHCLYIGFTAVRLWRAKQPPNYIIQQQKYAAKPKLSTKQIQASQNHCFVCKSIKPSRYYHCRRCQKCIYRMDHHCQWVSNCIGQYNMKMYIHLLVNVLIHSGVILVIIISNYDQLFDTSQNRVYYWITALPILFSLWEGYRLLRDFYFNVKNNQTLIQSFKRVQGKKYNFFDVLSQYFGNSRLMWLLPTFENDQNCQLFEKVYPLPDEVVKQYAYADEYIYGSDSQNEEQPQITKKE